MILNLILLVVGFVALIKGADVFVDGASGIARHFKISKMLIGLTIVAFGTSAPEFAVSVKSLLAGSGDIVLGNVIGSNILNILLILGVAAMVHSLKIKTNTVKRELPILLLMTAAFAVLLLDNVFNPEMSNTFTRSDGVLLVLFFAVFVYYLVAMARRKVEDEDSEERKMSLRKAVMWTVLGVVAIVVGSNLVVDGASGLATALGVSERMVALTIVALGTSLPELVTSVTATRKGEYDIAIGNVVGSNIFNIGMVMGLPVAIFGGIGPVTFSYVDVAVMVLAVVLLFIFGAKDKQIGKREGLIFLAVFAVYYGYVILQG